MVKVSKNKKRKILRKKMAAIERTRKVRSDKGKKRDSYVRTDGFFKRVFKGIKKFLESPFR
tara:strand:- start:225 stop:407 length:183 start_codon:yes stop_codon:yes gene_type:complete